MKKLHLLIIVALISAFAISCKKDDDDEVAPVYNSDEWVGHYIGESNGEVTVSNAGQSSTQPIESDMVFDIIQGNEANIIIMTDDSGETVSGTVSGNKVIFDEQTTTQTEQGVAMVLKNNMVATFNSTSCTIKWVITGTATYQGVEMPVTGNVTTIADKQ